MANPWLVTIYQTFKYLCMILDTYFLDKKYSYEKDF